MLTAGSQLQDMVRKYGAEIIENDQDGSIPVSQCTHVVADIIDFKDYDKAMAMMVPVVRPSWINASLHKNRQAQIRPYSPDPRLFFSNVVLTSDDIPVTDKEAIAGAVVALGGAESKDVGRLTTHICALSTDGPKVKLALSKKIKCKVVLPHWFDDCFRLGKRIDERPYLLPDPEILRANPDDPVAIPSSQHLEGATSARPDRPPYNEDGTRQKPTIFKGVEVCLSTDLNLNEQLRRTLGTLIKDGGGTTVDSAQECDWFICQYRDGPEYVKAAQQGKDVGSLAWLYHVIFTNQWSNPLRRLLHYPVPKGGMEGFRGLRITVSNYGGETRTYLQNLLKAAGAEVTGNMKQDNTHLITARKAGDKCEAAQDWNLPVVNHLWVEESYAKCELQALTDPRYTHFPPRTNLGEVIGQTCFDETRLHAKYYAGGDNDKDAVARRNRKMQDMLKENAQTHGPAAGLVVGRQRHSDFDVMKDDDEQYAEKTTAAFGVPAPPKPKPNPKAQAVATPVRATRTRPGKENDTPSVYSSGSRSAKASALSKLHDMAPDIALYEKERKRKSTGNTPFGGKRAASAYEQEREKVRERKSREKSSPAGDADAEQEEGQRPAKRQKSTLPPVDMRILLTGYQRWIDRLRQEDADKVRRATLFHARDLWSLLTHVNSENFAVWESSSSRKTLPATTSPRRKSSVLSNSCAHLPKGPRSSIPNTSMTAWSKGSVWMLMTTYSKTRRRRNSLASTCKLPSSELGRTRAVCCGGFRFTAHPRSRAGRTATAQLLKPTEPSSRRTMAAHRPSNQPKQGKTAKSRSRSTCSLRIARSRGTCGPDSRRWQETGTWSRG